MTPTEPPPLRLGRGLRILGVQMVQATGEIEEYDLSRAAMTVLTGPRNSSKTTTLNVIDYCLGYDKSVARKLGAAVEEKYISLSVDIAVDGHRHRITRDFDRGRRGRVLIDDNNDLAAGELSDWLLGRLGWPRLVIPLGVNPSTATQLTPLAFRAVLRHIYRREDSWTEFASKEQEFLRRAVVSLLLGLAPSRYETAEYDLGKAQRDLNAAEAVYRNVLDSTDESVRAVVTQLGLPPIIDSASLAGVRTELHRQLTTAQAEKDALTQAAAAATQQTEPTPGLDPELPHRLEQAAADAATAAERVASLRRVVAEHRRSRELVQADVDRLHRLVDAVDVFDELPVRICPACEQKVDPSRAHDHATCYLCTQPVSGDVRKRRAEREQRALAAELDDLSDALARAEADLDQARHAEAQAAEQRVHLARQLHDRRATQLAPFMAALEDTATQIGKIKQQLAALPALEMILARRATADQAVQDAHTEVERLTGLAIAETQMASDAADRCSRLADRMNEFLTGFQDRGWVQGLVTISTDDLTFYVGTRPWDQQLGAEARVLFFLAYCFGLLHLDADLNSRACPPGVLLLDNPYQQGLPANVVLNAVNRLASAAHQHGVQVVLTQARSASGITAPRAEIVMPNEYAG